VQVKKETESKVDNSQKFETIVKVETKSGNDVGIHSLYKF